ncbi:DUF305 domain-containing protein [Stenomitos frigidus ULC18]|uniref:DUF305 domain-containing protein n=2 Tax=Stenomitos TaxID=1844270 RepID=A0A2T1EGW6_9CYAN|nr:DUF305 domain-containing protein [Stenomitos frigidus ULC18]
MSLHFLTSKLLKKTGSLVLLLGAIASTSSLLNACSAAAQKQAQDPNPTVTAAGSMQMDHGNMNQAGGMMNHTMEMSLGPADANFDLRFIDAMTPHHQGAVVMAKEAQQKSKRPEIQTLAASIIKAQAKEIAEMKQWRQAWYPKASSTPMAWHAEMNHMMAMSESQTKGMMMSMDLGAADSQFDLRFLNAMIPHHEGAVTMAKEVLSKSKRPEIRQLAQAIIKSQNAEIAQMKQWKQTWYKQ